MTETAIRPVPRLRLTEGERFRLLRKRSGLTQRDLTALTGVAQSRISNWETGVSGLPADSERALWAAVTGE